MEKKPDFGGVKALSLCTALAAFGVANPGLAQTTAPEARTHLEEIVVTASRREVGLQDTPISVTALTSAYLRNRGITNFEEITKMVSGLDLEKTSASGSESIRIRGVGSPPLSGVDSSVGVLLDGVFQVRPGNIFAELSDVERVEILRGPQGTMFGRNTTAGAIQVITADPDTAKFGLDLEAVGGNLETHEFRGVINIPLIKDSLAIRISGYGAERDGHIDNNFLGKETQGIDRDGGRFKLLWEGNDYVRLEWLSEVTDTNGAVSSAMVRPGVNNVVPDFFRPDLFGVPWEVVAAELGKDLGPPTSLGKVAQDAPEEFDDDVDRHILTLDVSLPGHNLKSISAYEEFKGLLTDDRDITVLALSTLANKSRTEAWSQEFILTSEWDGPWEYTAGLFFQKEDLKSRTDVSFGADNDALTTSPQSALPIALSALGTTVAITERDNENRAVFANLAYELTDHWKIGAGFRYTEDEKEQISSFGNFAPAEVVGDEDTTFEEFTWTTKLEYRFDNGNLAYFSADRGFKSGGFNSPAVFPDAANLTPAEQALIAFDEETTNAYELGLKSELLDGRLRVNGAVFYQTFDDFQSTEPVPAQAQTLVRNAGEVDSVGAELDVLALVTDHLTINSSITAVRTEYDEFENAPCVGAAALVPGCTQDLSGERLDNAPRLTANVGVEYRRTADNILPGFNGLEWFTRADVVFTGNHNQHVALGEATDQGSYTLFSGRLGVETADGQWRFTIWSENIFDKSYAIAANETPAGVSRWQGLPRTWGATLGWSY